MLRFCLAGLLGVSLALGMKLAQPDAKELAALGERIDGQILTSADEEWDWASKTWFSAYDSNVPWVIVYAESETDVQLTLDVLARTEWDFRVRSSSSGGHSFAGFSICDGCVILDVSRLNEIQFLRMDDICPLSLTGHDTNRMSDVAVSVGPGVNQRQLNQAFRSWWVGFPLSGDCPQLTLTGYTMGGGVTFIARKYGVALDYLKSARIALANGKIITANADNKYSDLFRAIRGGGGGNFGVVLNLEFYTFNAPNPVLAFDLYWEYSAATALQLLQTWQKWFSDNSEKDLTAWMLLVTDANGDYVWRLVGHWLGDDMADGYATYDSILASIEAPFVESASKVWESNIFDSHDYFQLILDVPSFNGYWNSRISNDGYSDATLNQIIAGIEAKKDVSGVGLIIAFEPLGGQIPANDPDLDRTSFGGRNKFSNTLIISHWTEDTDTARDNTKAVDSYFNEILDGVGDNYYINYHYKFIDDFRLAYYGGADSELYQRLQSVKSKYDPNNLFRFEQSVEPQNVPT